MKRIFLSLSLVAAAASPVLAQSSELDATLATLAGAKGDAYIQARDGAVKNLKTEDLAAKLAGATWTDATFKNLAMATVVLAHRQDPEIVAKVNKLESLEHAVYSKRRLNRPDATRELKALGAKASGALLELHLKTFDRYPFSADEALAAKEMLALRIGIVLQLAYNKHPSAIFVAREVVHDASADEGARNQAASALGHIDSVESIRELVSIEGGATTPVHLKLAAVRGAGWASSSEAFEFLQEALKSADADMRRQAAIAMGTFCAPGAWDARGAIAAGEEFRRRAAAMLVEALEKDRLPADVIVDQIGVVAHASAKPLLDAAAANEKLASPQRETAKRASERLQTSLDRQK